MVGTPGRGPGGAHLPRHQFKQVRFRLARNVRYKIVCLIYMYAFPFTGTLFRLQVQKRTFGTLTRTIHISAWSTPIWTRPAAFERANRDLSNAAGLVQIRVDHAEIWSVFAGVPKIRICTCKRKTVPVNGKAYM